MQDLWNGRYKKKMNVTAYNNNVVILNEEKKSNEYQVNSIWIVYEVIYAY